MGNDREEDLHAHPGPVQCGPTHHHACACREAMFAEYKKAWEDSQDEFAELQARLAKAERVIDDLFDAIEELEGSPMNRNNKTLAIAAGYALLKDENKRLREALEFYAGNRPKEAVWEGAKLLTFDKFGGLDGDIMGPFVARAALEGK